MAYAEATAKRVQKWTWIMIYVAIVLVALGLSVSRSDVALGWVIAGPGIALIAGGIGLIWVRSRMTLAAPSGRPKALDKRQNSTET